MKKTSFFLFFLLSIFFAFETYANEKIQSFNKSKKILEKIIYTQVEPKTLYCNYSFSPQTKIIELPKSFYTEKHKKRANKIEWEHIVPAENFGRTFIEWREGHALCVDKKGKAFKGRNCAEKVNKEYRLMQADMYNLYPAVGAVNASRSNYNFTQFPANTPNSFGDCAIKIYDGKVEPPECARGIIARAYLYMEQQYKRYKMSNSQRKLMNAWNKLYPVTKDECLRTKLIEEIQGNENIIVKKLCVENKLW